MSWTTARQAEQESAQWCYERRRPEQTLLYQLVETHYPDFSDVLAAQGRSLRALDRGELTRAWSELREQRTPEKQAELDEADRERAEKLRRDP